GIGAQHMAKRARRHRRCAVTEVVVAAPTDVGHAGEGATACALTRQRPDLIAKVVADERESPVGQSGGKRPRRRLLGPNRFAAVTDPPEDTLALEDVQPPVAPAAHRLYPDFGGAPQVMDRRVPSLADRLPVLVEQRL